MGRKGLDKQGEICYNAGIRTEQGAPCVPSFCSPGQNDGRCGNLTYTGVCVMKKILATILALVMAIGVTTMAWATEPEVTTTEELTNAVANGGEIKLGASMTASITIDSGKTVTLDLNGFTLTNEDGKHTITNNGTLTIVDTSAAKSGKVDNVSHGKGALYNNVGATATLNGGTFDRSCEKGASADDNGGNSWYTIKNFGTMTVNAGVTVQQDGTANSGTTGKYSSLFANGWQNVGKAPGNGEPEHTADAVLTIKGGTFSGGINTVKNDEAGVLVVNGGNFSNTAQYVIMNWHKTTINNGTFKTLDTAKAVLFTSNYGGEANAATSAGELTITGGTFKRATDTQKMIVDAYDADNTGTASISGGTFDADVSQYLESGKQQNADGSVGNIPRYYYNSTTTTDTKKDDNKGTSPKTFDAGVGIYAVSAVLSVTGMAYVGKKKF